jgi:aldehyde:ferredoxin oxidoreductase
MKFLRVNLTSGSIAEEQIPKQYFSLGGRGLTSVMINDWIPADCDPLGEDNLLIFAPGFLSGTPLVNTGRLSTGAKSPHTGGIKESNVGGTMANALAWHGIRAVIIEGKAPEGTEMGRLVGNGPDAVGSHLGHSRVPTVKGQSIAGYDPRAMPEMGVTYATSPMGGDHTAGFVGGGGGSTDTLLNASKSSQVHMAELDFNRRAGLTEKDDRLPAMFHKELLSPYHGTVPYAENDLHGTSAKIRQSLYGAKMKTIEPYFKQVPFNCCLPRG